MSTDESSGPLSYSIYLRVPEILAQQHCLAKPPVHDELQFIIVHQVYELWFKLVLHELDAIRDMLDDGSETALRTAVRLCRRVDQIFKVLVQQIHVLETMRPSDFLKFRSHLNPASGFQSVQFREVECALGLKDRRLASFASSDPRYGELLRRLDTPSVVDALYGLLARRGFDVTRPSEERTEQQAGATLTALKRIYDDPDAHPLVYELCEALVDVDEQLVLWRRHHVMMVQRQIGDKPGTGKGTTGDLDGIRYLETTLTAKTLPDLWAVRTVIEE